MDSFTFSMQPPAPGITSLNSNKQPQYPIFNDGLQVRMTVFVDEQNCDPENEVDADDDRSWHWVVYAGDADGGCKAVGVVRLVPPPHGGHQHQHESGKPFVKIGRLAVLPTYRGKGLARRLVEMALEWAAEHKMDVGGGWEGLVLIHAQTDVEAMYARLGFETDKSLGQWDEEGILHVGMWKILEL
ncbi:acetyltransferase [Trichophyton equinum CBS 127.97]|uniref:Glucosamine 6-phosphate N-acetyltransferase n=1 Tax=Trichophyton equinum (strain ATCC MYA-4606 / CBS 127.97) TaxID=559882 RepID=F2PYR6_TRIEC|nr:acetyltransferase [Trichophyton equinum CBS 127.97]